MQKQEYSTISMEQQNMRRATPEIIPLFKENNVHLPLRGGNLQQSRALLQ
jgi:hypothetical protein